MTWQRREIGRRGIRRAARPATPSGRFVLGLVTRRSSQLSAADRPVGALLAHVVVHECRKNLAIVVRQVARPPQAQATTTVCEPVAEIRILRDTAPSPATSTPRAPASVRTGADAPVSARPRASSACAARARTGRPRCRTARRARVRTPGTPSERRTTGRPSWPPGWSRPSRGRRPPDPSARTAPVPASSARLRRRQPVRSIVLPPRPRGVIACRGVRGPTTIMRRPNDLSRRPRGDGVDVDRTTWVKLHARKCTEVKAEFGMARFAPLGGHAIRGPEQSSSRDSRGQTRSQPKPENFPTPRVIQDPRSRWDLRNEVLRNSGSGPQRRSSSSAAGRTAPGSANGPGGDESAVRAASARRHLRRPPLGSVPTGSPHRLRCRPGRQRPASRRRTGRLGIDQDRPGRPWAASSAVSQTAPVASSACQAAGSRSGAVSAGRSSASVAEVGRAGGSALAARRRLVAARRTAETPQPARRPAREPEESLDHEQREADIGRGPGDEGRHVARSTAAASPALSARRSPPAARRSARRGGWAPAPRQPPSPKRPSTGSLRPAWRTTARHPRSRRTSRSSPPGSDPSSPSRVPGRRWPGPRQRPAVRASARARVSSATASGSRHRAQGCMRLTLVRAAARPERVEHWAPCRWWCWLVVSGGSRFVAGVRAAYPRRRS